MASTDNSQLHYTKEEWPLGVGQKPEASWTFNTYFPAHGTELVASFSELGVGGGEETGQRK